MHIFETMNFGPVDYFALPIVVLLLILLALILIVPLWSVLSILRKRGRRG